MKNVAAVTMLLLGAAPGQDEPQPGLVGAYYSVGQELDDFPPLKDREPDLVRTDAQVNFESTEDAWPGTTFADHFAVRWSGLVRIAKDGTYTFSTESDDGSRLSIDGKAVVENGGLHPMEEKSGPVELKAGDHALVLDFFENGGGAGCKLSWEGPGVAKEIVPAAALFHRKTDLAAVVAPAPEPDLRAGVVGEYYNIGEGLEDFPTLGDKKPVLRRVDRRIAFESVEEEFYGTQLSDHFFVRWTGVLWVPKDGKYTLFTESDDGSRLFIDGQPVVSNGGLHPMEEQSGAVDLKAGRREIKVEFFENEGGAGCKVSWQGPDLGKQVIPGRSLWHKKDAALDKD
jgi:hypothetical protein